MSIADLKNAILKKKNPEMWILSQLENLLTTVEDLSKKVERRLEEIKKESDKIDETKLVALVASKFRQPQDGKSPDEEKVVQKVLSHIRQPQDGKSPIIDIEEIALRAANLIPPVEHGHTPVLGVDFELPEIEEETPLEIAGKLNTKKSILDMDVIKGLKAYLKNIERAIKEKHGGGSKGGSGGGTGNWLHQNTATTSATTTVTISTKVAANGYAILVRYNGKLLAHNVDYTLNNNTHVITFVGFTLENSTFVDVTWVRA